MESASHPLVADLPRRTDYIPLDLIDFPPLTRPHNSQKLASLKADMQKNGQLQNIVVCPKDGGRFELIIGKGRVLNARDLQWQKIKVDIIEGLTPLQKLQLMLAENDEREEDKNPIFRACTYKAMMEEGDLTQEQLAQVIHIKRGLLSQYLMIAGLPAPIKEIATHVAKLQKVHLLQICRLPKQEDQLEILQNYEKKPFPVAKLKEQVDTKLGVTPSPVAKNSSFDVTPEARLATCFQSKRGHPPSTHGRDGNPGSSVLDVNASGSRLTIHRDDGQGDTSPFHFSENGEKIAFSGEFLKSIGFEQAINLLKEAYDRWTVGNAQPKETKGSLREATIPIDLDNPPAGQSNSSGNGQG